MGNLQYRATVWVCRRLSKDLCSQDTCHPIKLFQCMINHNHTSWGHYAVYITWLHRHFRSQGIKVFDYLKKQHSNNMYSFWYLASQHLVYYACEIICFVCRSYRTRITGRHCQICQSTQARYPKGKRNNNWNSFLVIHCIRLDVDVFQPYPPKSLASMNNL